MVTLFVYGEWSHIYLPSKTVMGVYIYLTGIVFIYLVCFHEQNISNYLSLRYFSLLLRLGIALIRLKAHTILRLSCFNNALNESFSSKLIIIHVDILVK